MTVVILQLRSATLLVALLFLLPVAVPQAWAEETLLGQVCAGIPAVPKCAAVTDDPNTREKAAWILNLARLGDVATLATVMEKPADFDLKAERVTGMCLIGEPKNRLLALYGLAEYYRRPLIGFLRDAPRSSLTADEVADSAAVRKNSAVQLQTAILPALCDAASKSDAGERTTAALAAISLSRKLIAEAAAVEALRHGAGTGGTADQLRKAVKHQLICEVRSEADFDANNQCQFGSQIKSAILDDVASVQTNVLGLAKNIREKAERLNQRYAAWNAVERTLRTYAQVLADRPQGAAADPDQVAFEEALRTLRSAFEDRKLFASSQGEPSIWIDNELSCAKTGAGYPLCRVKGQGNQPLYPCPAERINERNIEKWLICLHSEGLNSVRAAKDAGLPAAGAAGGTRGDFLDWLWNVDAIAALAADKLIKPAP